MKSKFITLLLWVFVPSVMLAKAIADSQRVRERYHYDQSTPKGKL